MRSHAHAHLPHMPRPKAAAHVAGRCAKWAAVHALLGGVPEAARRCAGDGGATGALLVRMCAALGPSGAGAAGPPRPAAAGGARTTRLAHARRAAPKWPRTARSIRDLCGRCRPRFLATRLRTSHRTNPDRPSNPRPGSPHRPSACQPPIPKMRRRWPIPAQRALNST